MLIGLYALVLTLIGLGAVSWLALRILTWYSVTWKNRFKENKTENILPCCPQCGGNFGKWSGVITNKLPNNPSYPSLYGTYDQLTQSRTCNDCGYGDRRVM